MLTARTRPRWQPTPFPQAAAPGDGRTPHPATLPGQHPLVARLLAQRGVASPAEAGRFLKPKLNDLADPAGLPGCAAAADRLARAVRERQPIVVYGDYDVDGVTASAILWHTLTRLGHDAVTAYVPHRLEEGYGLNPEALTKFADAAAKPLVVTVDCGITAVDAAAHAEALGLELIITDHHALPAGALPTAASVVHPELDGVADPSPLCGAGVAFKLAWQTARVCCGSDRLPAEMQRLMLDLLALAALGTVADVVPLVGENRVITTHGLARIKDTPFDGLNALIDAADLRAEKVDAVHVGFVLGPRLNACGRMGHAKQAVSLLTDASPVRAAELADFLTKENDRRRSAERAILKQAKARVEAEGLASDGCRVIVLADEAWHPGVIGIVASRLAETYHRPAVLLGIDPATNEAKGSARSVEGLDLHAAMRECAGHCTKFGGHAMAAGLSLPPENIEAFRTQLVETVNARWSVADLTPTVTYDARVGLSECTLELFRVLEGLAPFGRSNPRPRLMIRGAVTARPGQRMGGEGKHLTLSLRDRHGHGVRAVGFGMGDLAEELPGGVEVDAVFEPKINVWRGVSSPELHLRAVRRSADADDAAGGD